jgi:hypothetical protein
MHVTSRLAAIAAAVLLAAAPLLAAAQAEPANPVRISSIEIWPLNDGNVGGYVRLTFVNEAPVAATDVELAVEQGGVPLELLHDKGTFSPGVAINHLYASLLMGSNLHGLDVVALYVKYADGSTWGRSLF